MTEMSDITILTEIIKKRRAIFPAVYSGEKIPKDKVVDGHCMDGPWESWSIGGEEGLRVCLE